MKLWNNSRSALAARHNIAACRMAASTLEKLQISIQETELLGERFLDVRAEMVQTDRGRQETREALTALRKLGPQQQSQPVSILRPAGVMLEVSVPAAIEILQQDQAHYEATLERLRAEEKRLMALLAEKGAGPQRVGPGVLQAMLNLKG